MRLKKIHKIFLITLILFLTLFFVKSNIKAANNEWLENPLGVTNPNTGITDVGQGIKIIVDGIITVAQVAFIVLFLIGGVMYLTSMGNEEQAKKSRALLLEAIIGMVIVTAAWAVSTWIIGRLKGNSTGSSTNSINENIKSSSINNIPKNSTSNKSTESNSSYSKTNNTSDTTTTNNYNNGYETDTASEEYEIGTVTDNNSSLPEGATIPE